MVIPLVLYSCFLLSLVVALFALVSIIVVLAGKQYLSPHAQKAWLKKNIITFAFALAIALGIVAITYRSGVGDMIFVSIKNRFLYGFKGVPPTSLPSIESLIPVPNHIGYDFTVEAHYHIKGSPFGTSELVKCWLDYIPNPTLKDLDTHFVNKHPEWKTRPNRYYYLRLKGTGKIKHITMDQNISHLAGKYIQLSVGRKEKPLMHDEFTKEKEIIPQSPKMVWPVYAKTTKEEFLKIPKDQPIVFVGDWDKKRMASYEKLRKEQK